MKPLPEYFTSTEAAKVLSISAQTLREWTDAGRVDVYATDGGHRRYLKEDITKLHEVEKARLLGIVGGHLYVSDNFISMDAKGNYDIFQEYSCQVKDVSGNIKSLDQLEKYQSWRIQEIVQNGSFMHIDTDHLESAVNEDGYIQIYFAVAAADEAACKVAYQKTLQDAKDWLKNNVQPVIGITRWRRLDQENDYIPQHEF